MLAEHMSKYQGASDAKLNEFKASLADHQKEYEAGVEQLRLLHQAYYVSKALFILFFLLFMHFAETWVFLQQNAALIHDKIDAAVVNSKKILTAFWKDTEEMNRERKKDLIMLKKV